jgi:hypothetical protein
MFVPLIQYRPWTCKVVNNKFCSYVPQGRCSGAGDLGRSMQEVRYEEAKDEDVRSEEGR